MSKQPEALTLADRLDAMSDSMDMGRPAVNDDRRQAAAELRRLHSLNAELVDALERISNAWSDAVQSDLEHGVRVLNEMAAAEFRKSYPSIFDIGKVINDEYLKFAEAQQ